MRVCVCVCVRVRAGAIGGVDVSWYIYKHKLCLYDTFLGRKLDGCTSVAMFEFVHEYMPVFMTI